MDCLPAGFSDEAKAGYALWVILRAKPVRLEARGSRVFVPCGN